MDTTLLYTMILGLTERLKKLETAVQQHYCESCDMHSAGMAECKKCKQPIPIDEE
jgi:hypothetical protein